MKVAKARIMRGAPRRVSVEIGIVGGAGHVGLPLAVAFCRAGGRVLIHDIDERAIGEIARGHMPFMDEGVEPLLRQALAGKKLEFSTDVKSLKNVPVVVVAIGTPIDEFLNPSLREIVRTFDGMAPHLSHAQLVVLRSTVYPGTTNWLAQYFRSKELKAGLAFCPERVVQGHALQELGRLPQIVSGATPEAESRAADLFLRVAPSVVRMGTMEAEFAKLFSNAYRYIQFAITNQFYMMANTAGLDYYRIIEGMRKDYPRLQDMPSAGLSAGPCLLKDTMQLAAFFDTGFSLGSSAMLINEGLPLYIVEQVARGRNLPESTVGLLGMAFKADNDDVRSSLSYKLRKLLLFKAKRVLTTDPYVKGDTEILPVDRVVEESDILILCAPHQVYRRLDLRGKPVVDIWNFFGLGGRI